MAIHSHKLIVVGGGLAGTRAVVEAGLLGTDVGWISKLFPTRSHSGEAQGGINAALANNPDGRDDSPQKHAYDTIKGSDFLADQDAVETMTAEAPARIRELEHWGVPFSRFPDGTIAQRPFGGAGFPRTCYGADRTGHFLLHTLFQKYLSMKQRITLYDEFYVVGLIVEDRVCRGVTAINFRTGSLDAFVGNAVIFATGGSGRTYGKTTNSFSSTGLGVALPYWAGLPIKDMEFVQFHPTCIIGKHILISEAARGEGGYLLNAAGERFMKRYTPKSMEISPRDIVSRSIQTETNEGRGIGGKDYVHLDLRHLGAARIMERLPGIRDISMDFLGVDPIDQPIPIRPAQHYTMGGIACDADGRTEVEGFYACGECACVSVHGANRLGGNSLLECVVFGARAGHHAARFVNGMGAPREDGLVSEALKGKAEELNELFSRGGAENPYEIRDRLHEILDTKVQIFRNRPDLQSAVDEIARLKQRFRSIRSPNGGHVFNYDRMWTLEIAANLDVAEAVALGALNREESRGSHFRTDFPTRDDRKWLTHTIARHSAAGPQLSYTPVTVTNWQPEERKY
jgi:succinate dehydrogenase / fumarate reductase, flavoprotein subunit